jgi:hypothetical protein
VPSPAATSARSSISRRILQEHSWESQTLAEVSRPFFNAYKFWYIAIILVQSVHIEYVIDN